MTAPSVPAGTSARIPIGPGWRTVQLDSGERVQVLALNRNDVPTEIEWPVASGQMRRIAEVLDGGQVRP